MAKAGLSTIFFIERNGISVKWDYVYIKVPANGFELYKGLQDYMDYFNNRLFHQGINHQIPVSLYKSLE